MEGAGLHELPCVCGELCLPALLRDLHRLSETFGGSRELIAYGHTDLAGALSAQSLAMDSVERKPQSLGQPDHQSGPASLALFLLAPSPA